MGSAFAVPDSAKPPSLTLDLHDGVASRCLAEPLRTQLRSTFLRLEVDVHEPEAVAIAVDPLEVSTQNEATEATCQSAPVIDLMDAPPPPA